MRHVSVRQTIFRPGLALGPLLRRSALLAVAVAPIATCALGDRGIAPSSARAIDAVFADLDRPGSPGAAVAVVAHGRIMFAKGYGFAQTEHAVPVTPRTVFHVASVSKQFTAMAAMMLAAEGAISLDDPVRRHLPFVPPLRHPGEPSGAPDSAQPTVRQMIHHTSGIRDQWQLLAIAGWRLDDVITTDQILDIMTNQQELNFPPGDEYLYSNMGYTLLGQIVRAKSGVSFPEFAKSEIFRPLGMNRTHFHDDHEHVVPGRAYSYAPFDTGDNLAGPADSDSEADRRYKKAVLSYANAGATSLFTTAEDLALWLDNFRHQRVGGPAVASLMTSRGVLNNGDSIPYAGGVVAGQYRGLSTFSHGGADAGFRSHVMWFPQAETGVVVLANVSDANPGQRARHVADVVLADLFPAPQEEAGEDQSAGNDGSDAPEAEPPGLPQATLDALSGSYYSPELDALYHLRVSDGGLVANHVRHGEIRLEPVSASEDTIEFEGDRWFFRSARFLRRGEEPAVEMRVGGGRVRNVLFVRLADPLPGSRSAAGGNEVEPAMDSPSVPEYPFPTPTGPLPIGMAEYRWVDEARPDPFTADPADVRSVAARIWYPAATSAGSPPGALYIQDAAEFGAAPDFVPVAHARTNAVLNAPAAPGPFPVLLYHHGGGWTRFTSTFTTEEMASHGYVVISVGHNGFNKTLVLPDGTSAAPDALPFPELTGDFLADALGAWEFLGEHHFPVWTDDAAFVLDQLAEMNRLGRFRGRLDLDRIGMYGWSFGGAASIEMAATDPRVKAPIDHDGQLFGSAPVSGVDKPFMLMHAGAPPAAPPAEDSAAAAATARAIEQLMEEVARTDSALIAASSADWHDITIAGTNHGSFSDLVLFLPGASPGIDAARGHEIINALTRAFFDRYLKGVRASLLDDPSVRFPEVTAVSR